MPKRHEERTCIYICLGWALGWREVWYHGGFYFNSNEKKSYDGNVFSSNQERSPLHLIMSLIILCCCCLVAELHPALCNPMGFSSPDFPVLHHPWCLLKLMAINTAMLFNHLLLHHPRSPFAFNLSQHQGLVQSVGSLHQVAKVLELQLYHQSFQWIFSVLMPNKWPKLRFSVEVIVDLKRWLSLSWWSSYPIAYRHFWTVWTLLVPHVWGQISIVL